MIHAVVQSRGVRIGMLLGLTLLTAIAARFSDVAHLVTTPLLVAAVSVFILSRLVDVVAPREDRSLLRLIVLGGFLLRVGVAATVLYYSLLSTGDLLSYAVQDDSVRYDDIASRLAASWITGEPFVFSKTHWGYYYTLGLEYYLLGHSIPAAVFLNCFFNAATILLAYQLGRALFDSRVGLMAAAGLALYSGYVAMSVRLIRDSILFFLIAFVVVQTVKYMAEGRLRLLVLALIGCAIVYPYRFYMGIVLLMFTVLSAVLVMRQHRLRSAGVLVVGVVIVGIVFARTNTLGFLALNFFFDEQWTTYLVSQSGQTGAAGWDPGVSISVDPANLTNSGVLAALLSQPAELVRNLLVGFFRLTFSPFAWILPGTGDEHASSFSEGYMVYLLYPGMWLWYLVFPAALLGIYHALRTRPRLAAPVILLVIGMMSLYAVVLLGNDFRYRDQFMPMLLVFAAYGILRAKAYVRLLWFWGVLLTAGILTHLRATGVLMGITVLGMMVTAWGVYQIVGSRHVEGEETARLV